MPAADALLEKEPWLAALEATPLWLLGMFTALAGFSLVFAWLAGKTAFGRRFARLAKPCLAGRSKTRPALLLAALLLLILIDVRLSVLQTYFYNGLYTSLQKQLAAAFWFFALINGIQAAVKIAHTVIHEYADQVLILAWTKRLNAVLTERWLADKNYCRLARASAVPDNIDQRIQQDGQDFIINTVTFASGALNALVSVISYTALLWALSGILPVFGIEIPRGMVFFIYLFIIIATAISVWIGRPLVRLSYQNERYNGDYRYALVRLRDNAEAVAFYRGEAGEAENLRRRFVRIIENRWRMVYKSLSLNGFNTGITQISNLLPLMLQAPRFFAGLVTLGDMHQTVQAFNRLQRGLSYFRNIYEAFTAYQARLQRLDDFLTSTEQLPAQTPTRETGEGLEIRDLTLQKPDGGALFAGVNLSVKGGERVLLQAPSGSGKTSLLRAAAGIWTAGGSGTITAPEQDKVLFLPQRPYLPQGTLKTAICYPYAAGDDAPVLVLMRTCRLGHLTHLLHIEDDWQHKLSPGELQRIAFARALMARPELILLDEASAALDEDCEQYLHTLLFTAHPNAAVLSVGHRSSLLKLHERTAQLPSVFCG